MKRLTLLTVLISLGLLLVACGGSSGESDTTTAEENVLEEATTEEEVVAEEPEEEVASEEESAAEEMEDTAEETVVEETDPPAEEEMDSEEMADSPASGFGDLPLTGTDSETGLVINPPKVNPGETALVRGTIISMNLTPTTSPEFLVQIEDGTKYRFRSQDLDDTFFLDGSQLKPYEYKIGMLGQAVITLAADAGPSDLATSDNLTFISMGE